MMTYESDQGGGMTYARAVSRSGQRVHAFDDPRIDMLPVLRECPMSEATRLWLFAALADGQEIGWAACDAFVVAAPGRFRPNDPLSCAACVRELRRREFGPCIVYVEVEAA
jgi:hypothetical protein